jgi:glycosyl transferase, family 25
MFEFIENVVYINLLHRTDRKSQIESELQKYFPVEKFQRFNAIQHSHGGVGCVMSHIAVLEMAISKGWTNVLIIEDDAMWNKFETGYPLLEKLSKNDYDVIVLGAAFAKYDSNYRLSKCTTTTAYIVNKAYYQIILENFKEGLEKLLSTGKWSTFALDQYWSRIQLTGKWYATIPSLMIQRPGMSDIEKRFVNNQKCFS